LRALYDAAGPVIRFRILRDVLGRDESFIETAHLGLDVRSLPEAEAIIAAQEIDGSWGGALYETRGESITTEIAVLRLCELGLEQCESLRQCVEKAFLPTLLREDILWEYEARAEKTAARRLVRDKALRLITRCTRDADDVLKPLLESVLVEWDHSLSEKHGAVLPPTADSWAAVCHFPWSDDDFSRVRVLARRLAKRAEVEMDHTVHAPDFFALHAFRLCDKWEYLARPPLLFHELELAARLGVAADLPHTRWLLEELEARQDADGFFRFDLEVPIEPSWYFPLEKTRPEEFHIEWSFRAAHIFTLLGYDM